MKIRLLNENMEFSQVRILNRKDSALADIIKANEQNSRPVNNPIQIPNGERFGLQPNSQKLTPQIPSVPPNSLVFTSEKTNPGQSFNGELRRLQGDFPIRKADQEIGHSSLYQPDPLKKSQQPLPSTIRSTNNFASNVLPERNNPPGTISYITERGQQHPNNRATNIDCKPVMQMPLHEKELPRGRILLNSPQLAPHNQPLTYVRKNSTDQKPHMGIRKSSNKHEFGNETSFNFDRPELNEIFEAWSVAHNSKAPLLKSPQSKIEESPSDIVFARKQQYPPPSNLKRPMSPQTELSEELLACKRLKKINAEESERVFCPICYTDNEAGNHVKINSCTHLFCYPCICEWSKVANQCPLCKQEFTEISIMEKGVLARKEKIEPKRQVYEEEINSEEELIANADNFCYFCEGTNDDNYLLICDHCNLKCCHTFCLDPPLQFVPQDEWYCDYCFRNFGVRGNNPIAGMFTRNGRQRRRQRRNPPRSQPQRNPTRRNRRTEQSQNSSIDELSRPNTRTFVRRRTARTEEVSDEDFVLPEQNLRPTRRNRRIGSVQSQQSEREPSVRSRNNARAQTNQRSDNRTAAQISDRELEMLFSGDIDRVIGENSGGSNRRRRVYLEDSGDTEDTRPNGALNTERKESRDYLSGNTLAANQTYNRIHLNTQTANIQRPQPNPQISNRPNVSQFLTQNQKACDAFIDDAQMRMATINEMDRFRYGRDVPIRPREHGQQSTRRPIQDPSNQIGSHETRVNALNFEKAMEQLDQQHRKGGEFVRRRL